MTVLVLSWSVKLFCMVISPSVIGFEAVDSMVYRCSNCES